MAGQFLSWFKNYLSVVNYQELPSTTTRVQRVVFDGAASQWAPVTSGVQQGSLLGPLLFTIFFNDLPNASEGIVTTALYVDDTKIFNCIGSEEDCKKLQTTLSKMEHWSKKKQRLLQCVPMQNTKRCEKEEALVLQLQP